MEPRIDVSLVGLVNECDVGLVKMEGESEPSPAEPMVASCEQFVCENEPSPAEPVVESIEQVMVKVEDECKPNIKAKIIELGPAEPMGAISEPVECMHQNGLAVECV